MNSYINMQKSSCFGLYEDPSYEASIAGEEELPESYSAPSLILTPLSSKGQVKKNVTIDPRVGKQYFTEAS